MDSDETILPVAPGTDAPKQSESIGPQQAHTLPEARSITRERGRDLRELISKYVHRHAPRPTPVATDADTAPPRFAGSYAKLLPLLRIVPWILLAGFTTSFFWDFPEIALTFGGQSLPLAGLLRISSVSGLIGFLTNWLAITMLFNPREKRPIFGQGLIPSQRERVIYRLAKAVSDELINEEIIKQRIEESGVITRYREMALDITRGVLEDPEFRQELKTLTSDYITRVVASEEIRRRIVDFTVQKIEEQAGQGISGLALRIYRFVNEDDFQKRLDAAVLEIPTGVDHVLDEMDHLLDRIPEKIESRSDEIEDWVTRIVLGFVEKLNVYDMIMTNMQAYDDRKLETLLKNTTNEQLNYIKYLGGVLGVLGGLVIWRPLYAISAFFAVGLVLVALDQVLYRLAR